MKKETKKTHSLFTSVLLLLLAIAAITATTLAWLSIADNTKVRSMYMDVTAEGNLRFDLDPHEDFSQYTTKLGFGDIGNRMKANLGFDMLVDPLLPVTTTNCSSFYFEDGSQVLESSGSYLTFELNFMALTDMTVHLTSLPSRGNDDGTKITSSQQQLPPAMRISFTVDNTTVIYNPSMGAKSTMNNGIKMFGLNNDKISDDTSALFELQEKVNKKVLIHIWLEGTDPNCTNELKKMDYSIAMRFVGVSENYEEL